MGLWEDVATLNLFTGCCCSEISQINANKEFKLDQTAYSNGLMHTLLINAVKIINCSN